MSAQSYTSATAIKARLSITDLSDDTLLGTLATEVNSWLEVKIGFPVGPITSEERKFDGSRMIHGGRALSCYPFGVRSVTAMSVASSTGGSYTALTVATDIFLRPATHDRKTDWPAFEIWLSDTGSQPVFPGQVGFDLAKVTGTWGWAAIPSELSSIATRLGVALWRRRSAGAGQYAETEGDVDQVAAEELSASDWRTIWEYEQLRDIGAH